ncbi:MAG TPA: leishmanolysin-related zinc metalloendopeptidase [Longimicrobiales bacterium]
MRFLSSGALVAGCLLAAACGDSPTSEGPTATNMVQTGTLPGAKTAGSTLSPSVRLTNASGQPVAGARVEFEVAGGGGSISTSSVTTNSNGVATLPTWTLGPGLVANTLVARHASLPPVQLTVWGCATFCIDIRFVGTMTAAQHAAFVNARQRWEQVITGDLPPVQFNVPADPCKDQNGNVLVPTPSLNEVIDDLVIYVEADSIDGAGKVLGSAGPCYIRSTSRLPVFGIMLFDDADLARMENTGTLNDVILHELGHVLGFPSIWSDSLFITQKGALLIGEGSDDPYFTGTNAASRFQQAGGTLVNGEGVPIENTGDDGTRDSHWREAVLQNELMTGFISAAGNPLSAITIGSLMDMGYQVDFGAADAFTVSSPGMIAGLRAEPGQMLIERPLAPPRIVH